MAGPDHVVLKDRLTNIDNAIENLRLQIEYLNRLLTRLVSGDLIIMSTDLTSLQTAVAADTDATNSALKLINGFAALLAEAGADPAKLKTLSDQLSANASALSAAVAANTPADPTVPTP